MVVVGSVDPAAWQLLVITVHPFSPAGCRAPHPVTATVVFSERGVQGLTDGTGQVPCAGPDDDVLGHPPQLDVGALEDLHNSAQPLVRIQSAQAMTAPIA
ncbi:hypothetical protein GCM10010266_69210 [Streptomyces griseomycini]|nr:hypothetical protein GCM10010266_69210 [Streptomyces griseomycini]GGR53889.1 hypothetical protein GCM10015536_69060 [Streptomyces griseomycini]